MSKPTILALAGGALAAAALVVSTAGASARGSVTGAHASAAPSAFVSSLRSMSTIGSTVPPNGDVNPYGLAVVPTSVGSLQAGDYLVSNFNAKSNNQGTGTTIVQLTPGGKLSVFATVTAKTLPGSCPGGVGLTTALGILPGGYVVVGSLPTTNGTSATAQYGCLIVLNSSGKAVETIAGKNIQGPWDMTSVTQGSTTTLFVSNVFSGGAKVGLKAVDNSTVLRIRLSTAGGRAPTVQSEQVVADGIPWRDDKTALAIGPTGVALAANGTLYVADTLESRIIAIPQAMTRSTPLFDKGITVSANGHLKQPLGLILAPNGNILTTNASDGNIVETTAAGHQIATVAGDAKTGAGSLFGLAIAPGGKGLVYVDDGSNTLRLLH
jgi:sugar lactone lactonase YvrE